MATTKYIIAEQVQMLLKGGNPTAASTVELADIMRAVGQVVNSMFKTEYLSVNLPSGETMPEGLMLGMYEKIPVVPFLSVSKAVIPIVPVILPRNLGVYHVGIDNTKAGSGFAYISITQDVISHAENSGSAGTTNFVFPVTRSGNEVITVTLFYQVIPAGTHPADATDFIGGVLPTGSITFNPDEITKNITIPVRFDTTIEFDETFQVIIFNGSAGSNIIESIGTGLIINDDFDTRLDIDAVGSVDLPEGNFGTTVYTYRITRSGNTTGTTTCDWAVDVTGSTVANAADFVGGVIPSGNILFAPGDLTKDIEVHVQGDTVIEPNEKFTVFISNPSFGAHIGSGSVISTIENDDVTTSIFDDSFDNTFN